MKTCTNCSAEIKDDAKFCPYCGTPVQTSVKEPVFTSIPEVPQAKSYGKVIIPIALSAVLVCGGFTGWKMTAGSDVNRVMKQIRDGNMFKAMDIYSHDVQGNRKKEAQLHDKYDLYLDEIYQDFHDEKADYEQTVKTLENMENFTLCYAKLEEVYDKVIDLGNDRSNFEEAQKAYNETRYEDAVRYCSWIDEDSELYGKASELSNESTRQIIAIIYDKAESHRKTGDYSTAKAILSDAVMKYPEEKGFMEQLIKVEGEERDARVKEVLKRADELADNHDYEAAIEVLETASAEDPDATDYEKNKAELEKEYETYIINASRECYDAGDYIKARNLTNTYLANHSSSEVKKLNDIYKSYIPVSLVDMEIFKNEARDSSGWGSAYQTGHSNQDSYGNRYDTSMACSEGSVTYLVNYKYDTFRGTVAFPKGYNADSFRESATLTVYGDEDVIAKFENVTLDTKPMYFDIDISRYEKIRLEWTSDGANIWNNWGEFATIYDGEFVPIEMNMPE